MSKPNFNFLDSTIQPRRKFLQNLGTVSGALFLSPVLASCNSESYSPLYERFLKPDAKAQPFFRWWWNGNRLSRDEISRELRLMKDAGIGGVEINPIKMPDQVEEPGGEEQIWLSDEWIDFLEFTISEANSLGMVTDLIVGTGWPFGGEFLKPEETIQGIKLETIQLQGPRKTTIDLPKPGDDHDYKIIKITMFPEHISSLNEGIKLPFESNSESISVDVPPGSHKLIILLWQNNFRQVMHGAPGGAGSVLDHFNRPAVERYLNHMSDKIKQRTGKDTLEGIRAMFCDSIELNGANWTSGFEDIFKDRKGYDILPYLPLLLGDEVSISGTLSDTLKRAYFDYSQTLAELFAENFIEPFHRWCHENGTLSRYQAYGHPWLYTDLVDGYLIPDIPEGDQWLFNGGWQPYADVDQIRYAIWNKYTSSGGHLANRKIISTEAMTNTRGVFKASLKYIKQATDLNIATGINHQVLHGFNYSPPDAPFPGWIRYGCYFNENNPWWQYMPNWSEYSSRICQLMQDAKPLTQVAIMGPTADIWSDHGLDRNPFNLEPWYLHSLWQALNHLGFSSDYINGKLLSASNVQNGKISIENGKFDILLLCEVETILPEAARKIELLCQQGMKVVIIGKQPSRSPSMLGALKNDGIVKKAIENATNTGLLFASSPEDSLKPSPELLMKWTDQLMKNCGVAPKVSFSKPSDKIFQFQKQTDNAQILFVSNMDRKENFTSNILWGDIAQSAARWDPSTGKKYAIQKSNAGQIPVNLQPLESILLVSDPIQNTKRLKTYSDGTPIKAFELTGTWNLELHDVLQGKSKEQLEKLKLINELSGYSDFGGEITYRLQFQTTDNSYHWLNIEEVYETAEVILNGKKIGLSWWGNSKFELGRSLKKGNNKLEIKVTTLLANLCSSLKDNKTAQSWTNRYEDKSPVLCGINGRIYLT